MNKYTEGSGYESERSPNQELTFNEERKELTIRGLDLGEDHFKLLKMQNEEGEYNNLALLLSDQCPYRFIMAVFGGADGNVLMERKEAQGSLFKQMRECFSFIEKNNKSKTRKKGLFNVEEKDYPEVAIREAVVNAFVHRDYSYPSDAILNLYEDRMEIISIGGLSEDLTTEDIKMGISIVRNRNLTDVFYRLSLVDSNGKGISNIFRIYESESKQPLIQVSSNVFKMILPNRNYETEDDLPRSEQVVLKLFADKSEIQRVDVQEALGIEQTMAGRILRRMQSAGLIDSTGAGKNIRYIKIRR